MKGLHGALDAHQRRFGEALWVLVAQQEELGAAAGIDSPTETETYIAEVVNLIFYKKSSIVLLLSKIV